MGLAWIPLSLFMLGRGVMLQPNTKYLIKGDNDVFISSFSSHLPGPMLSLQGLNNEQEKYKLSTVW